MSRLPSLLDDLSPRAGNNPAAVIDNSHSLSIEELKVTSRSQAQRLNNAVFGEEPAENKRGTCSSQQVVALLAPNGVTWISIDIACQLNGFPFLPLPPFFTDGQMVNALEETQAALVLIEPSQLQAPQDSLQGSGHYQRTGHRQELAHYLSEKYYRHEDIAGLHCYRRKLVSGCLSLPQGTGKITFTSGSTGQPKGVCLSNEQLMLQSRVLSDTLNLDQPRHLCLLPLAVLLENIAGVYCCLMSGGQVLMPNLKDLGFRGSSSLDVERLLQAITESAPNTLILMPQLLFVLISACHRGWTPPESLQFIAVGGSRVSADLIAEAKKLGLPVYEGYGLSECASVVSLNLPGNQERPGSAGKPLPHLKVRIEKGEILVQGNPFLGYVGQKESWYTSSIATGDLGYLDADGFLHLNGRRKNLLISSFGRNISPEWVESELLSGGPIREAIVMGDARPALTALIYPAQGISRSDIENWLEAVNSRLPDYAQIHFWHQLSSPLASFPGLITSNGKPRRQEISRYFETEIEQLYTPEHKSKEDVQVDNLAPNTKAPQKHPENTNSQNLCSL